MKWALDCKNNIVLMIKGNEQGRLDLAYETYA